MHTICFKYFFVLKFRTINITRKIIPKLSNIDSFKYSILTSLHYYDISYHPEIISKLKPFENKYNFIDTTPNEFEINNPNISLTVFCEKNKIIYKPNNISGNKAEIVEIENHGYAAIKPLQDKFIKLNKSLKSSSYV